MGRASETNWKQEEVRRNDPGAVRSGPGVGGVMNDNGEIIRRQWEEPESLLRHSRRNVKSSGHQLRWEIHDVAVMSGRH